MFFVTVRIRVRVRARVRDRLRVRVRVRVRLGLGLGLELGLEARLLHREDPTLLVPLGHGLHVVCRASGLGVANPNLHVGDRADGRGDEPRQSEDRVDHEAQSDDECVPMVGRAWLGVTVQGEGDLG